MGQGGGWGGEQGSNQKYVDYEMHFTTFDIQPQDLVCSRYPQEVCKPCFALPVRKIYQDNFH